MSYLFLILVSLNGLLLGLDWLVKRRRLSRRRNLAAEEFLAAFRGPEPTMSDDQILEARRLLADELGLPVTKIHPDDRLTDLRDRYCLVVAGHLALGDLIGDLQKDAPDRTSAPVAPETVNDYVAISLRAGS